MKNKGIVIKATIGLFILLVAILTGVYIKKNILLNKTYGYETGITNIAQYVDDGNTSVSSASFVFENIDPKTKENLSGNKVKIYSNDDVELTFLNTQTNDEIQVNNNIITLDEYGVTVKVDGISKGNSYDIHVEPVEVNRGYKASYKTSTIALDYTDGLSAYVKEMIDTNNQPMELSEQDKMVFLYTDENDKIKLRANEEVDIEYTYSLDELSEEELAVSTFSPYNKDNYLKVETNGYLYAKAKYKTSAFSKISVLHITNIDKQKPYAVVNSVTENSDKLSATINFTIDDKEATKEYGKSEVIKYAISKSVSEPYEDEWIDATAGTYDYVVQDNKTFYIYTLDRAGNIGSDSVEVNNITFYQPGYYVLILDSTNHDLIGNVYETLMEMKADFEAHNLTNNDTVLAQIEGDIKNQYINVDNVNLTIDLNGYVLESREDVPTFNIIEGAQLKIVDNKYEIEDYIHYGINGYTCNILEQPVNFDYTGEEQTYHIDNAGTYLLETWGAQGGSNNNTRGGYGAYSVGYANMTDDTTLYVNVGGAGTGGSSSVAGFNGGGAANHSGSWTRGSGGGATHIATKSGLLSNLEDSIDNILIVAGGGGGAGYYNSSNMSNGGDAGGYIGGAGNGSSPGQIQGQGGTQLSGGTGVNYGSFGHGANRESSSDFGGSGGGAGYYGGGASTNTAAGGGGSSYIGNPLLQHKLMVCYNCEENDVSNTRTKSVDKVSSDPLTNSAKSGNGYARITKVDCEESNVDYAEFEHGTQPGTIKNVNNDAIVVNPGSILQVGEENSPDLAHIEYPDHTSPYIAGKGKAITNRGTFNYYDGVIFGGIALDGDVQDSPYIYDPNVVQIENDYRMTLEKVTNIEAMIGKTRYTLLENAIDVANRRKGTPADQIKIDIVNDLAKDLVIEVNDQKNIILDLNGHTFTNVIQEPVLVNYGKLVIMDSGTDGVIISHNGFNTIENKPNAELTVNSGKIDNDSKNQNAIFNDYDAKFTLNGGSINQSFEGNALYNNGGNVDIKGGTLTAVNPNWYRSYSDKYNALYNRDYYDEVVADNVTNVPLSSFDKKSNSSHGFVLDDNNEYLIPEDYNLMNDSSYSYVIVDLTNENPNKIYKVELDAYININETEWFWAYYRNDDGIQGYSSDYNRFAFANGSLGDQTYTVTISGGQKYYFNIAYFDFNSAMPGEEGASEVIVKGFRVKEMHPHVGIVNVTGGLFDNGEICYHNESLYNQNVINGGTFNCRYSAYTNNGDVVINDGTFNSEIINDELRTFYINGGNVKSIWNRNGTVRITGGTIGILNNKYEHGERDLHEHLDNYAYITGGEFYDRIENWQTMDIKNATISGDLYQYSYLPVSIENTHFIKELTGLENNTIYSIYSDTPSGDLLLKNDSFDADLTSYDVSFRYFYYHGIYKLNSSSLALDGVNMNMVAHKGSSNDDGRDYRAIQAITNTGDGNIYLDNTTINVSSDYDRFFTYAVYNTGKADLYIGKKDNVYEEDRNLLNSDYHSLYNPNGLIHFYDGVIKGDTLATDDVINQIEDEYYVYRYDNNGADTIKLVANNLGNVLNVGTNQTYNTLSEALDAAGSSATLRFLNDYCYETINRTYEIKNNQDITIDLNGKKIFLGNGLLNNGKLKIVDSSNKTAIVTSQSFINNNDFSIEAGKWIFEIDGLDGITNNGKLTIKTSYITASEHSRRENIIKNNGQFYVEDGAVINIGDSVILRILLNTQTGSSYINGGELIGESSAYGSRTSFEGRNIENEGGYVEINGGTISSYSVNDYGNSNSIKNIGFIPEHEGGEESNSTILVGSYNSVTIPVDLSDYSGDVKVTVKYQYYPGFVDESRYMNMTLINSETYPTENYDVYTNNYVFDGTLEKTLTGGSKHYIYTYSPNSSQVYITSIIIEQNGESKDLFIRPKMVMNGGTITEKYNERMILNYNADFEMNGGLIQNVNNVGGVRGVYNYRGTNFKMTSGKIKDVGISVYFQDYSHGLFTGGEIIQDNQYYYEQRGLYVDSGLVDIDDLTIKIINNDTNGYNRSLIISSNYSEININDGTFLLNHSANNAVGFRLNNYSKTKVKDIDLTVTSENQNTKSGIYISENSNLDLINSNVTVTGHPAYGIFLHDNSRDNVINITKSNIIANASSDSYGIYADGISTPKITITNDDTNDDGYVSQTTPIIKGNTYGIYRKAGIFNFYDGIIKGETQIYGGVTDRPVGYELMYGNDGTINTVVLEKLEVIENVDTGVSYSTFESAFNACTDNIVCNLRQIYNVNLSVNQTIPNNKIVNLDLNGKNVTTGEDSYLINNGTLIVSNGNINSQGVDNNDPIFINNGTLKIENGTKITTNDLVASRVIYNKPRASIYINGGTIDTLQSASFTRYDIPGRIVYNEGGYVEINGGTITGNSTDYYGRSFSFKNVAVAPDVENGENIEGVILVGSFRSVTIPVDLSDYSGDVKVTVKYQYYPGYVDESRYMNMTLTNSETYPTENYDVYTNNYVFDGTLEKTVTGGSKHYIYTYSPNSSSVYITSIIIEQNGESKDLFIRPKMVMNGGTITDLGNEKMILNNNADFEMTGGTIKESENVDGIAVYNYRGTYHKMTGGTILDKATPVFFDQYSHGLFDGGEIITGYAGTGMYGLYLNEGLVDVNTLTINIDNNNDSWQERVLFKALNSSVLNINGGSYRIMTNSGYGYGVLLQNYATAKLANASLNVYDEATDRTKYGINMLDNSNIEINNSNITVSSYNSYGIYTRSANKVDIINSSISASGENSYGYYAESFSNPTITVTNNDGDEDSNVSTTKPMIKGELYGIYRRGGTLDFRDGIFKGKVGIYGGVNTRPNDYNLLFGSEGSLETVTLAKKKVVKNNDTGVEYDSIQEAVNACPNNQICSLKQIYRINLFEQTIIPNNKIVRYDGNEQLLQIVGHNNIVNYGDFTYINGTIEAHSISDYSAIIDNYGTLNIEDGTTIDTKDLVAARIIYNRADARIYINGGVLKATENPAYTRLSIEGRIIYNEGGYVEINGGNITGYSYDYYGMTRSIRNIAKVPDNFSGTEYNGTIHVQEYRGYSLIPIDTTGYTGTVKLQIIYDEIVRYNNSEVFIAIDESESEPSGTFNKIVSHNNQGELYDASAEVELEGGKIYYLHPCSFSGASMYIKTLNLVQGTNKTEIIKHPTMKINGGVIIDLGDNTTIQNFNANFEMNGGVLRSDAVSQGTGIQNYKGTIFKMTNGNITDRGVGVAFYERTYGKFTGGRITTSINSVIWSGVYGIYANNSIVDYEDGNIYIFNDTGSYERAGIRLAEHSELKMTAGTIDVMFEDPYNNIYGIYASEGSNIQLGDNDGLVDQHIPRIKGYNYGIYLASNDSTFNFFDGRITSKGVQIQGEVDTIPDDYQIVQQGDDYYLDIRSIIENTVEYNKMYFEGLNMPIELIRKLDDKKGTIKLWNDTTAFTQVVIPEGVEITIALEGHQLDFDEGIEVGIINNGTLHIIDGNGEEIDEDTESLMINLQGVVIENNGTLTVGESNNPNKHSPIIKGKTAITGNSATLLSGKIESTEGGIIQTIGSILSNLFTFDFAEPSYSYVSNNYQVNNLPADSILATEPSYRSIESLDIWTKEDIHVGMTSHNVGILNLVSTRDPGQTKEIEYTIEVYKNGILDEFYTYRKVVDVQYLEDDILSVDLDWFDGAESKFKDYYLSKMTINDKETSDIPEMVYDGTKFKLYYGQTKGEEIVLNNPKTGRRTYKAYFLIALIASIFIIGFMMSRYIKHMTIKEDTV